MSDEISGMDPGVGAPGPGYRNGFPDHYRKGMFEALLNRHCIGLYLPAVKMRAFVGQFYEVSLCQRIIFRQK